MSISNQVVVPQLSKNAKPKIGLVWAGSSTQQINHHRSCPIDEMLKIVDTENFDFYGLQTPLSEEDKGLLKTAGVIDLEQELISYSHSGALIQQMDLVISVCTSVIHLAGALNIPSIVLLSPQADWRWLMNEEQSTWYPNTSILRQEKSGDWASLMTNCKALIQERLG